MDVSKKLAMAGFEAYLVGGCVRDLLMGDEVLRLRSGSSAPQFGGPRDWDVATNARPQAIIDLFSSFVHAPEDAWGYGTTSPF